jgi:hypothetical protein
MKIAAFWDTAPCSLVRVYSNETTRRYIPEGSNLHSRRRENLISHRQEINKRRKQ